MTNVKPPRRKKYLVMPVRVGIQAVDMNMIQPVNLHFANLLARGHVPVRMGRREIFGLCYAADQA
jgi:hypothetical protein